LIANNCDSTADLLSSIRINDGFVHHEAARANFEIVSWESAVTQGGLTKLQPTAPPRYVFDVDVS